MHIFISSDMEGTCGITDWSETERSTPRDYEPFRKEMTREVKAACEGAIRGGAEEIFVRDAHDYARNIDCSELPENVKILRGWTGDPLSMMSGLDTAPFDAVLFTGYHSWAMGVGNPLSHTMNTQNEFVLLNGKPMSEFVMNALTAGYYKVPVAFLSGDKALCESAGEWIPGITTVPVNEGIGGGVISVHPQVACRSITEKVAEALEKVRENPASLLPPMPKHFEMVIRFKEHKVAYSRSFYPGAELSEGKNVCYAGDNWYEMLRFCHFVLST